VPNKEKSNLIANSFSNVYQSHDFNVSTADIEAVSIDIIRKSVIELTPYVLVSPTEVRNTI
jgi:capsular polysaccharide biosynthesis protein